MGLFNWAPPGLIDNMEKAGNSLGLGKESHSEELNENVHKNERWKA